MLLTISGVSGSGKSTVVKHLIQEHDFELVPSWTTRPKRHNESMNTTYNFITQNEFEKMNSANEFILIDEVSGNYYGTRKQDLFDTLSFNSNKSVVDFTSKSVIDMVKMNILPSISIFLYLNLDESINRMQKRGDLTININSRKEFYFRELIHGVELATINKELIFINTNRSTNFVLSEIDEILINH